MKIKQKTTKIFYLLDKIYLELDIKDKESFSKLTLKFEKDLKKIIK